MIFYESLFSLSFQELLLHKKNLKKNNKFQRPAKNLKLRYLLEATVFENNLKDKFK